MAGCAPTYLRGRYLGLHGAVCSLDALLAPLGGTQLLGAGAPALWLTCGAVAAAAALGQLALSPALRRRTRPHHSPTTPSPPATLARAQTTGPIPPQAADAQNGTICTRPHARAKLPHTRQIRRFARSRAK